MASQNFPSEEVIEAVANEEGLDPAELRSPLYDAIDPDALDALFRNSAGAVSFEYHGYAVVVTSDGIVQLTPK